VLIYSTRKFSPYRAVLNLMIHIVNARLSILKINRTQATKRRPQHRQDEIFCKRIPITWRVVTLGTLIRRCHERACKEGQAHVPAPNTISQYLKFRIYTELYCYCLQQVGLDNGATKLERQRENKTELHYRKKSKLNLYSCLIRHDAVWTHKGLDVYVHVILGSS
jgi:hypothetical protein